MGLKEEILADQKGRELGALLAGTVPGDRTAGRGQPYLPYKLTEETQPACGTQAQQKKDCKLDKSKQKRKIQDCVLEGMLLPKSKIVRKGH